MLYSLKKVLHNIKKNFAVYIVFVLEFSLGLSIFLGCRAAISTAENDLTAAEARMNNKVVPITYYGISFDYKDTYGILLPYENYLEITEKYKDKLEFRFAYKSQTAFSVDEEFIYPDIYFINDEYFEAVFHTEMDHSKAYIGSEVSALITEALNKHGKSYEDLTFYDFEPLTAMNEKQLTMFDKHVLNAAPLPHTDEPPVILPGWSNDKTLAERDRAYKLDSSILFSVDLLPDMEQLYKDSVDDYNSKPKPEPIITEDGSVITIAPNSTGSILCINVAFLEGKYDTTLLPMLLNDLNSPENYAIFSAGNEVVEAQGEVQFLKRQLRDYQLIALGILIIVVVGNIGTMLILINRRKKAIAISCAYGATITIIAVETFAELLSVTLIGALTAFAALTVASPALNSIYPGTQIQLQHFSAGLLIAVVTAVIPSIAAVNSLHKLSLTEILKSN